MNNDPFGIYEKTPHLKPGHQAPGVKLPAGYVVDFSKSPELTAPRKPVPRFTKGLVCDFSKSPELANSRETLYAGELAKNLDYQARAGGGAPPPADVKPEEPKPAEPPAEAEEEDSGINDELGEGETENG